MLEFIKVNGKQSQGRIAVFVTNQFSFGYLFTVALKTF